MLYPVPGGVFTSYSAAIAGRKNIQIDFIIGKGEIGLGRGETRRGLLEASLTLEASLSLTVFIFAVIILAMPMEMLDTQRKIQTVLETTARELSPYAYIFYRRTEGEELRDTAGTDSLVTAELFAEGAVRAFLEVKIREAAGPGRISGLDLSGTEIMKNGEEIYLRAKYRLMLPFRVFVLDSVPAASVSFKRGWIGSEGGRNSQGGAEADKSERMVFIGRTGTRYHLSPDCHYISNDISSLDYDTVKDKLSSSQSHYKPCSICGSAAVSGTTVYIMPNGKYFHSRPDCTSIAYYVKKVPLSEVEHLGACSYCGTFHTPPQASGRVGDCAYESFVPGEDCRGLGLREKIQSAEHTPAL